MNYEEFKRFDKLVQIEIALEEGVVIGQRLEHGDFLQLFHLGAFYVELRYLYDQSEIIAIYHSECDDILVPYLKGIDISHILSD